MTTFAVIPARYASSRFPGKPLAKDTGKYLIQHVYERVSESSRIDRVIVATDDDRIVSAVTSFHGEVCMTRVDHPSGTDRIAEVISSIDVMEHDLVLNVQGDEPEIDASVLDELITLMEKQSDACGIGTLATPFDDDGPKEGNGSPLDPNCVKVVLDANQRALYFSRSAIPYPHESGGTVNQPSRWLLHMGVYAFRVGTLRKITTGAFRNPGLLEQTESLEQLRWMEHGLPIAVHTVQHRFVGVDTPEDYTAFVKRMQSLQKTIVT